MAAPDIPVLVVGAGPTGMMFSLWMTQFGIKHRIVDAAPSAGTSSRAMLMHARTLEFYRQLGMVDAVLERGTIVQKLIIYHDSVARGMLPTAEGGIGISKFPFIFSLPQDDHEAVQEETLAKLGVTVERNTRLEALDASDANGPVRATIRKDGRDEHLTAGYVIGCDGAHSTVRRKMAIEMLGNTADRTFFVADVINRGTPIKNQFNMCLSKEDFLIVLPLPHREGRTRLAGFVPRDIDASGREDVTFEDVKETIARNAKHIEVESLEWFTRYKVHHRMAEQFMKDRVFLCGDAAHIHSPIGGQGMNTGLGDATNLAWKLASVIQGRAPTEILATYGAEREPFAHMLVNTTDALFMRVTSNTLLGRILRTVFIPYLFPRIVQWFRLAPIFFRRTSQIRIEYRDSSLSTDCGSAGPKTAAKAGDRLPWVELDGALGDNFALLINAAGWQAHVYGTAPAWADKQLAVRGVALRTVPWDAGMAAKGLRQNVVYLLRPDGYIGLMVAADGNESQNSAELDAYMARWGVGTA